MDWGRKEKDMKFREFMALQLFAEDEGTGAESNGSGANGGETQGNEESNGASGNTFEDFLKDGKNQAEFDRRVNKAIETALGNAKVKWQEDADQKAEEAAKVAKMNAEQKQQYEMDKLKKENERLQAESVKNQLSRNASVVLPLMRKFQNQCLLTCCCCSDKSLCFTHIFTSLSHIPEIPLQLSRCQRKRNPPEFLISLTDSCILSQPFREIFCILFHHLLNFQSTESASV